MVAVQTYAIGRLTLEALLEVRLDLDLTLLMKSADSRDQPSGISNLLIWTYLAKIYSLISLRLFPM